MKRKPLLPVPVAEPEVVAPEIIEGARKALEAERAKPVVPCVVCGAEATPNSAEQLCWVCRRLKISAWRDVEQQIPVQE
jgi:Zn finger protein HypA/HybF involved in hydrogenase expression